MPRNRCHSDIRSLKLARAHSSIQTTALVRQGPDAVVRLTFFTRPVKCSVGMRIFLYVMLTITKLQRRPQGLIYKPFEFLNLICIGLHVLLHQCR